MSLVLYFDGASRGNPGPAGAGVYIETQPASDMQYTIAKYLGRQTNNQAEYKALILGLKKSVEIFSKTPGFDKLLVMGDSQLVLMQVFGTWKVRKQHLRPLHAECIELLENVRKMGITCKHKHVKREFNSTADQLANDGIDNH